MPWTEQQDTRTAC